MNLKNLKISTQLRIGFGILLFFVAVLGGISYFQTEKIQSQMDSLFKHPLQVRRAIGTLRSDILTIQRDLKDLFLTTDEKEILLDLNQIEISKASAYEQIEIINKQYLGPHADVVSLKNSLLIWNPVFEETIRLLRTGKTTEAANRAKAFGIGGKQAEALLRDLQKIDDFAINKGDNLYDASVKINKMLNRQLVEWIIVILLLSLIINFFLLRNIRKPLKELTDATNRFQNGDMNARTSYNLKNEFGVLSDSFNKLAESIHKNIELSNKTAKFSGLMLSQYDAEKFFQSILNELSSYTGSQMAAVYLLNNDKKSFDHFGSIGTDDNAKQSFDAGKFEGEFGKVLLTKKVEHLNTIPTDTGFFLILLMGNLFRLK